MILLKQNHLSPPYTDYDNGNYHDTLHQTDRSCLFLEIAFVETTTPHNKISRIMLPIKIAQSSPNHYFIIISCPFEV